MKVVTQLKYLSQFLIAHPGTPPRLQPCSGLTTYITRLTFLKLESPQARGKRKIQLDTPYRKATDTEISDLCYRVVNEYKSGYTTQVSFAILHCSPRL
jgi:hypothetical protein